MMTQAIPSEFNASAYFAQNGETAWARDDAIRVIRWATSASVAIIGVEVWLPTVPGPTIPTPYVYTFEPQAIAGESRAQFIQRANREVTTYIQTFVWDPRDVDHCNCEPYFNITLE